MPPRRAVLLVYALLMAVALALVLWRMQISSDLSLFLPQGASTEQRVLGETLRRGVQGKVMLAAISGGSLDERIRVNQSLARALQKSGLFGLVNNGRGGLPKSLRTLLDEYRYLLSPVMSAQLFSESGLRQALQARLADLASAQASIIKRRLPQDPLNAWLALLAQWAGERQLHSERGVYVSADGARSLMLLYPHAPSSDLDRQQQTVELIQQQFAQLAGPDMKLLLTGPAAIAVETRNRIRDEARLLSAAASLMAIAFLFVAFRSWRAVFWGIVPLLSGVLAGMLAATLFFPKVHGITLAFGVTLLGIAVDYPMHVLSHLSDPRGTTLERVRRIWPTLRLGAITTVIGFSALGFAGYGGLMQLGVFSVAGLAAAAATTRWLLPALLPADLVLTPGLGWAQARLQVIARAAPRLHPVVGLLVAGAVFVLWQAGPQRWQSDPAALTPLSQAARARDELLRADMNAPFANELLLVSGPNREAVMRHAEALMPALQRLKQTGLLKSYEMISQFLPSRRTQLQRQGWIPEKAELQTRLKKAARGLPFKPDLFAPFVDQAAQARGLRPLTTDDFKGLLGERFNTLLFPFEDRWVAPVVLNGLTSLQPLASVLGARGDIDVRHVQVKREMIAMVSAYRDRGLAVFVVGALSIALVLWLGLRQLESTVRVLVTPVTVVLLTAASMWLLTPGGLTLFHLVALLLVMGLGIDYALFFNRLGQHPGEWHSTFPALWKSWLTTVLVFGSLALSSAPVLIALGLTVSIGVSLCFVVGAVLSRAEDSQPAGSDAGATG